MGTRDSDDPGYREGQVLARVARMERELRETRSSLDEIQAEQRSQGTKLKGIAETAQEWEALSAISKKIRGRVGALLIAAIIGLPGAAVAIAVQWVRYDNMTAQVANLSRRLSYDPEEEKSVPNQMKAIREDVRDLSSELRGWQRHQEERLDDVNERTKTLETTTVRRRRRAPQEQP